MNDPLQTNEPAEDVHALSKHTTPTWEIELLISGATVFALMQLPGLLDRAYQQLLAQVGASMAQLLLIAYIYFKAATLVLIATFILHLGLRAYWSRWSVSSRCIRMVFAGTP
jgi:hypothetical protein